MDFIKQVIGDFKIDLIIGSIFIVLGIIVPTFHLYWLIAGVNTAPKEQLRKIDLKYVEKFFGVFIALMGLLLITNPFIFSYFGLKAQIKYIQPLSILVVIVLMFVFGKIKQKRINKQSN